MLFKIKKEAIKKLNKLLESYINDSTGKYLKKANLLSYWIKDYTRMISFEESFEPTRNIAYKRGNIVNLNFWFNIGSEYGGLHYGIVLDNNNHHSSPVITIIPLTSVKDSKRIHENSVYLGNEIYKSLRIKHDTIYDSCKIEREELGQTLDYFSSLIKITEETFNNLSKQITTESKEQNLIKLYQYLDEANKMKENLEKKQRHVIDQLNHLEKIDDEILNMKMGSVALVNQITTISKIRIFDPRNLKGVLAGVSLSSESMEKINQKLKELYVF